MALSRGLPASPPPEGLVGLLSLFCSGLETPLHPLRCDRKTNWQTLQTVSQTAAVLFAAKRAPRRRLWQSETAIMAGQTSGV